MKEYIIKINRNKQWVMLGTFNKTQTIETIKDYLIMGIQFMVIPLKVR